MVVVQKAGVGNVIKSVFSAVDKGLHSQIERLVHWQKVYSYKLKEEQ
jgi:hypothetical protein